MKPVSFLPAAREEFLAAASHYDTVAPVLGDDFITAVERAVARMADMLVDSIEAGSELRDQTRATIASEVLSAKGLDKKNK